MLKQGSRPVASQKVVMNGVETTGGSTRAALASRGIDPPTVAAMEQIPSNISPITQPSPRP